MTIATNSRNAKTWAALMTSERARDWKRFVADVMVFLTRRAEQRALISGYQVVAVGDKYLIKVNDMSSYTPMTPEILYSWAERLPLVDVLRRADDYRAEILSS